MFKDNDTSSAPWHVVRSDDKRRARLNVISHLLTQVPYEKLPRDKPVLPKRQKAHGYVDPTTRISSFPNSNGQRASRLLQLKQLDFISDTSSRLH